MTETAMHTETGQYSIVVDKLSKNYGHFRALNDISFQIKPGEIVGFLGPNGAGKTTTMKILTCFMTGSSGSASVAGYDVYSQSEMVRQKIGYLPENVPLYDEMIVYDYLMFIAQIRQVERSKRHARIKAVAELTGLTHVISKSIHELSKGYRQRVGLAQAIIHEPDVIILDEPTTGLDPNQIVEIRDVIKTIGREKTIIFSTHIMQEVTAVCDRIIIINQGEIVADGTLDQLEQKVSDARSKLIVTYDKEKRSTSDIFDRLQSIPGIKKVSPVTLRSDELCFQLQLSGNDTEIRQAIIQHEAEHRDGLRSLKYAEPTLEDIFRLYTGGVTQETDKSPTKEVSNA